jgi:eukaryotic-like serine/threonine-protein kinase
LATLVRQNEKVLRLDYECLHTMPTGIREVRVWWDDIRGTWIVGKRLDLSEVQDDADLIEPRVMEIIDHPNVVKVQSVAVVEGFPEPMHVVEVFMPYYEQGSISDAFETGRSLSPHEALRITRGVLHGLAQMHDVHGILHRDIKSPNLFLTSDSHLVKIGDLGLAGRIGLDGKAPCVNAPHIYSPPELLGDDGLTRSSDLYSVGVVLRELLAGKYDYSAYTTTEVVDALADGKIPLHAADLKLPVWACGALRKAVRKATQKDPLKRYQSARDMNESLAKIRTADWRQTDEACWEAPMVHQPARRVRVTALPARGGMIKISIHKHGIKWRRASKDVLVPSLDHADAKAAFETANTLAIS